MLIALYSPHGSRDATYLANYAYINLNDPIARLYGIGQTQVFGAGQYAIRLWVKPDQMAKLGITVTDIYNALQAQNTVNPAGQVGGEPAQNDQKFTYAVLAQGRLKTPEQFADVIVREAPNGGTVRVRDVARVELGTQDYSLSGRLNGQPSAVIAVYQLPGTNAVQTVEGVRKLMTQMKQRFPQDIDYAVSLDQTLPVTAGMKEIFWTLVIAIVLVIFCPVTEGMKEILETLVMRLCGGLSLPARLARHAYPDACRACLADRHIRHLPVVRFLDQYAFDVRIGTRDWTRGR